MCGSACLSPTSIQGLKLEGCLHESGLIYNPGRTHCVSVKTVEDCIIFVYMNPDRISTQSGSSSFHFSFWIEHTMWNEILNWNHVNMDRDFTLE